MAEERVPIYQLRVYLVPGPSKPGEPVLEVEAQVHKALMEDLPEGSQQALKADSIRLMRGRLNELNKEEGII